MSGKQSLGPSFVTTSKKRKAADNAKVSRPYIKRVSDLRPSLEQKHINFLLLYLNDPQKYENDEVFLAKMASCGMPCKSMKSVKEQIRDWGKVLCKRKINGKEVLCVHSSKNTKIVLSKEKYNQIINEAHLGTGHFIWSTTARDKEGKGIHNSYLSTLNLIEADFGVGCQEFGIPKYMIYEGVANCRECTLGVKKLPPLSKVLPSLSTSNSGKEFMYFDPDALNESRNMDLSDAHITMVWPKPQTGSVWYDQKGLATEKDEFVKLNGVIRELSMELGAVAQGDQLAKDVFMTKLYCAERLVKEQKQQKASIESSPVSLKSNFFSEFAELQKTYLDLGRMDLFLYDVNLLTMKYNFLTRSDMFLAQVDATVKQFALLKQQSNSVSPEEPAQKKNKLMSIDESVSKKKDDITVKPGKFVSLNDCLMKEKQAPSCGKDNSTVADQSTINAISNASTEEVSFIDKTTTACSGKSIVTLTSSQKRSPTESNSPSSEEVSLVDKTITTCSIKSILTLTSSQKSSPTESNSPSSEEVSLVDKTITACSSKSILTLTSSQKSSPIESNSPSSEKVSLVDKTTMACSIKSIVNVTSSQKSSPIESSSPLSEKVSVVDKTTRTCSRNSIVTVASSQNNNPIELNSTTSFKSSNNDSDCMNLVSKVSELNRIFCAPKPSHSKISNVRGSSITDISPILRLLTNNSAGKCEVSTASVSEDLSVRKVPDSSRIIKDHVYATKEKEGTKHGIVSQVVASTQCFTVTHVNTSIARSLANRKKKVNLSLFSNACQMEHSEALVKENCKKYNVTYTAPPPNETKKERKARRQRLKRAQEKVAGTLGDLKKKVADSLSVALDAIRSPTYDDKIKQEQHCSNEPIKVSDHVKLNNSSVEKSGDDEKLHDFVYQSGCKDKLNSAGTTVIKSDCTNSMEEKSGPAAAVTKVAVNNMNIFKRKPISFNEEALKKIDGIMKRRSETEKKD